MDGWLKTTDKKEHLKVNKRKYVNYDDGGGGRS